MTTLFPTPARLLPVALLALLGAAAWTAAPAQAQASQPGRAAPAQPAPVVVEPPLRDFGVVEPGAKLPTTFTLRNPTSQPMTIQAALPSCKCTTVEGLVGKVIPPGGSLELPATMEAPTVPGVKEAKINLVFAGFNKPTLASLRCEVLLSIKAAEEFVDALKGVTSGVLTIESRDGKPFRILSSNGAPPEFVDFDPSSDAPRSSYRLRWSVEGWPCEGMRLWWIVETDRPDCPILPCRIRHECSGVKADPRYRERTWILKEPIVNAGRVKAGETVRLKLEVENGEPKSGPNKPAQLNPSFRQISAVQSTSPDAVTTMVACQPRGIDEALVTFDYTPSATASGLLYTIVRIYSPTGTADVAVVASVEP